MVGDMLDGLISMLPNSFSHYFHIRTRIASADIVR